MLAAIAQRKTSAPELEAAREWTKRDYQIMAGPGAQKLGGAHRAFIVDGVGVLPITGPIFPRANLLTEMSGATSIAMLQHDHGIMLANRDVRRIMLLIDSPGGAVSGIADFTMRVASGATRKETRAYVSGAAASAAYWIASAASHISLDRTALVGSIGVVAAVPKQVQPDQDGVVAVEIVSSNAPKKRPDPQSDDGLNVIRESLNALEAVFVSDVAKGRKVTTRKVLEDFGQGGVLIGAAAVKAGMADTVQTQSAAMRALAASAAIGPRANVGAITSGPASANLSNRQRLMALKLRRLHA